MGSNGNTQQQQQEQYRGINPLWNGGIESAASLHPHYQQKLHLAPNSMPAQNAPSNAPPQPVYSVAQLVALDQAAFMQQNYQSTRNPSRFDVQNQQLPLGGEPLWPTHRDMLGGPRADSTNMAFSLPPYQPQPDVSDIYLNPGPFQHTMAATSSQPAAYSFDAESVRRMMRPVDEVDPGLVTNPIPDQTFMARQPTFDKSAEDAATQRWRLQTNGAMRFF